MSKKLQNVNVVNKILVGEQKFQTREAFEAFDVFDSNGVSLRLKGT